MKMGKNPGNSSQKIEKKCKNGKDMKKEESAINERKKTANISCPSQ